MIVLALLAAMQDAPPPTDDIVVIANRMRMIEVDLKAPKRNGRLVLERCRITRSSGYAELDAVACDTARECMTDNPATRRALERCAEERSQGRLDAIIDRWRAARVAGQ